MDETNLRTILGMTGVNKMRHSGPNHLAINCLFPWNHEKGTDTRPSMTVSIDAMGPSFVKCFTCGYVKSLKLALWELSRHRPGANLGELAKWVEDNECKGVPQSVALPEIEHDYTDAARTLARNVMPKEAVEFLRSKGVKDAAVIEENLLWDQRKELILFPLFKRRRGSLVVLGAGCRKLRLGPKDRKYWLYWPIETRFHLYGEHLLSTWDSPKILLVEGYLDALHAWQEKVPCAAIMGKSWSSAKATILRSCGIREVVLCLDPDTYSPDRHTVDATLSGIRADGIQAIDVRLDRDPKYYSGDDLRSILSTPIIGGPHGAQGEETGSRDPGPRSGDPGPVRRKHVPRRHQVEGQRPDGRGEPSP